MLIKNSIDEIKKSFYLMGEYRRGYIASLLGIGVIDVICSILVMFIVKNLTNAVIEKDINLLKTSARYLVLLVTISAAIKPLFEYSNNIYVKKIMIRIRGCVSEKLTKLDISYFDKSHTSEIISRINNDVFVMEKIYNAQYKSLFNTVLVGIASAVMMLMLNSFLAVLIISVGLLLAFINTKYATSLRKASEKVQRQKSIQLKVFVTILSSFLTMKMYNIEKEYLNKYEQESNQQEESEIERANKTGKYRSIEFPLRVGSSNVINIIGVFLVFRRVVDYGTVSAVLGLTNKVNYMMMNFSRMYTEIQTSLVSGVRVLELLEMDNEFEFTMNNDKEIISSAVNLTNVSFGYDDDYIINDLTMSVKKGQQVAVVGSSGSGKSTILKLLLGLYNINCGTVSINGRMIWDYSKEDLRNEIAYVPQDNILFNATVIENIRYGNQNASDVDVVIAAKKAYAHKFIEELPDGYDTLLGENGTNLSGGEKQRLAIARAILKNAPILLLDEATSALDYTSEKEVQKAICELKKGKTVICVAHRLSSVVDSDEIYLLDGGRIAEVGNHERLLRLDGKYKKMFVNNQIVLEHV